MNDQNNKDAIAELAIAFNNVPFNRVLGLTLDSLDSSSISMSFKMKDDLIGNYVHKILHGGVISTALDMAGGMAVMLHALDQHAHQSIEDLALIIGKTSTIDLHINYLRPGKGTHFKVNAYLVKGGKKVSFSRMELINEDNTLIATGTGTYLLS